MITFAYPWLISVGVSIGLVAVITRRWWYRPYSYFFPLHRLVSTHEKSNLRILYALRIGALCALCCALSRPRQLIERKFFPQKGIDIMLACDISGSMQLYDDLSDKRSRWQIARKEAIHFIEQRPHDNIGLVLFGAVAISRCPLTFDKKMVQNILQETEVGIINEQDTMLGAALMLAAKKLNNTSGVSKIIIMFTDGIPSPRDVPSMRVIEYLKQHHIKVYTIGIGGEVGYFDDPFFGTQRHVTPLNKVLLNDIAEQTGGLFFEARKAQDLNEIYEHINTLETFDHNVPYYDHYQEYFIYCLWIAFFLLMMEYLYAWSIRWL